VYFIFHSQCSCSLVTGRNARYRNYSRKEILGFIAPQRWHDWRRRSHGWWCTCRPWR